MNKKQLKDLTLILVPLIIILGASITLVNTGIITFEKPINTVNKITVTLTIDNGVETVSYEVITDNATAYDVLEKAEKETDLTFEAEYFEEYQSHKINSINGAEGNTTYYWIFYLNGEMAPVGADQQYVEEGDIITFILEKSPY